MTQILYNLTLHDFEFFPEPQSFKKQRKEAEKELQEIRAKITALLPESDRGLMGDLEDTQNHVNTHIEMDEFVKSFRIGALFMLEVIYS